MQGFLIGGSIEVVESNLAITPPGRGTVNFTGTECSITDSTIVSTDIEPQVAHGYCETLTIIDNAPQITATPLSLEVAQGDTFNPFSGVSAEDIKDGDLSEDVIVIGSVGEDPGTYELVYSVTDEGTTIFNEFDSATTTAGPSIGSVTRTVTRLGTGESAESTRVGKRSTSAEPSDSSSVKSLDETLATLRTVLAEPISTTDPEQLKKLLNLLLQLAVALSQIMALEER